MSLEIRQASTLVDPVASRILAEEGDRQAAINRLVALHWTRQEARAEIARCLRNGVRHEPRPRTESHG